MRGLYHYIIATFELKTETSSSAEDDTCRVMVWCCTPAIQVAGAEVHHICINKTCYECEVGGGLNHKTHCDSYSYSQEIHSQVPESIYKARATSL